VDDLKSSHVDTKVNDEFLQWLNKAHANDGIGEVKAVQGKKHDYCLAMNLDCGIPGAVQIDVVDHVKNMVEDFPEELDQKEHNALGMINCSKVDEKSPLLNACKAEHFHSFVMRAMFATKCAWPDVHTGVAFLSGWTKAPTEQDWFKLKKIM